MAGESAARRVPCTITCVAVPSAIRKAASRASNFCSKMATKRSPNTIKSIGQSGFKPVTRTATHDVGPCVLCPLILTPRGQAENHFQILMEILIVGVNIVKLNTGTCMCSCRTLWWCTVPMFLSRTLWWCIVLMFLSRTLVGCTTPMILPYTMVGYTTASSSPTAPLPS